MLPLVGRDLPTHRGPGSSTLMNNYSALNAEVVSNVKGISYSVRCSEMFNIPEAAILVGNSRETLPGLVDAIRPVVLAIEDTSLGNKQARTGGATPSAPASPARTSNVASLDGNDAVDCVEKRDLDPENATGGIDGVEQGQEKGNIVGGDNDTTNGDAMNGTQEASTPQASTVAPPRGPSKKRVIIDESQIVAPQ